MKFFRNFLAETRTRIQNEWKFYQLSARDPNLTRAALIDSDYRRHYNSARANTTIETDEQAFEAYLQTIISRRIEADTSNFKYFEPYEFFRTYDSTFVIPDTRIPAPGIRLVPLHYHTGMIIDTPQELKNSSHPENEFENTAMTLDPRIRNLLLTTFPQYYHIINEYVRPLGTTTASFANFNCEQKPSDPIPDSRRERILYHIRQSFDATPYLPLHFVDSQYAKMPLSTGTGYHNRHSFRRNAHAHFSHPPEYSQKHTSKGYYYNATYSDLRTSVHYVKATGFPHSLPDFDPDNEQHVITAINSLIKYYAERPTIMFTRNHISKPDALKSRPVYAVDDECLFGYEAPLTFPLLVQARKPSCHIMYGLETIRGSNHLIDKLALAYNSFLMIDWSRYDQTLPWIIVFIYYMYYLPSLIVISHGYAPTYEYESYPDLDEHSLYERIDNMLFFLMNWFVNMTFITADGYAYKRTHAGVASGQFNTNYLDSFGNDFLLVDGLIAFGCTDPEISAILRLIMGDDNSLFTQWPISRLEAFLSFFADYALRRWNMTLSQSKSVLTELRNKIQTLSYECNFGMPLRPIDKLVAQLCYPEHGVQDKYMSMRAVGLAYASAAQDDTFHSLCHHVYLIFLPHAVFSADIAEKTRKWLFPVTGISDDAYLNIDLLTFPSIYEVRKIHSFYHGPLGYSPKWNYAHFKTDPDYVPPDYVTMEMYRAKHGIIPRDPLFLPDEPITS
jgi:hypothetical protein